ncbi:MAG: MFS transporter [Planctomycetota bacterium]|nr:MFS transporter [Planctomycetota bacterium]
MREWIVLAALRYRNFRLFFFGQGISLIGTWMQQVAMIWLVYRLGNSVFLLGLVGFCSQIPSFFLAPVAGVYTDRWNLHRTILLTQSLAMCQALSLAVLTLTGTVAVWHVLVLSVCLGLVNALDIPARQAFLIRMVEGRESLPNAIGLNSSMFNGARLVGPTIAGFLIALVGEGVCFLLNALSYVAVLAALLAMRLPRQAPAKPQQHVLHELLEGFRYAIRFLPIRDILLLLAFVNMAAMSLTVLLPVFATKVLQGGSDTLGLLTAAIGLGALLGALCLAYRKSVLGLGRQIAWASALLGLSLVAFSFSAVLWLSLLLLVIGGFAVMMETAASNTILQTIVDDDKRGRVMSFYAMAFLGAAPLGSLLAGSLASHLGVASVVRLGGILCLVGSAVFAWRLSVLREIVRPIYQRIGILPDVTSGIPCEAEVNVTENGES